MTPDSVKVVGFFYIDRMVYVDDAYNSFKSGNRGRVYKMSHMIAESVDELHEMAQKLGMKRKWFQPKSFPHYDLTKTNRLKAIKLGARSISTREMVGIIKQKRQSA